jgi:hypothetical protein
MARGKTNVVPIGGDGGGDQPAGNNETVKTISEKDFAVLLKKVKSAQGSMDTDRASIGGYISDAVEHKFLHKGAFGIFRRLDRMEPYKRSELLYHLDIYRERTAWDTTDLFERDNEAAE